MSRYFTGSNVKDTEVTQSEAACFRDLVQRMINMPVRLNVTRAQYHAMPEAVRKKAKLTAYLVACTFPASPWEGRKLEHAQECNLLFLDIDSDGKDCPAAPFVRRPELLMERLGRFNFAAYRTISSTEESPRLRVVVEARSIPVARYADAVLTLAQIMGLPYVTRESIIAVQAMFRPSVFSDQDVDTDHPLVATHFNGEPFTTQHIAADLDSLPGTVSGGRGSSQVKVTTGDLVEDYFQFLQLPVPEITLEVAQVALGVVPPDCSYPEWLDMACALRHQFPEQEAEAYEMFDAWSKKGLKYIGPEDTAAKWKSIKSQPKGRAPKTIRSLLKLAAEHGWDGRQVKAECYKSVNDWVMFHCKSGNEILTEGPIRIAALHGLSVTEEQMLAATMVATLRQSFKMSGMTVATIKKAVARLREMAVYKREDKTKVIPMPWANGWVYVASTNEFFQQSTGRKLNREAFNSANSRWLLPTVEDLQKADVEVTQAALHRPMFLPADYLLNHVQCKTVDDYDYDPSQPEELITGLPGAMQFVNTYRKSYRAPDASLAGYAEEVMTQHLHNLVAEEEYRRIILDWMAFIVQNPGMKVRWAILLQGAEGCGKTAILNAMQTVLGPDNVRLINNQTLEKGWSEWATGAQVIGIEEIRAVGHNRHDMLNMLKEPITNDYVTVNSRGQATRTMRTSTNYFALTNYHDGLPLDEDSRRWCVIKSSMQKKEQVVAMKDARPGYFTKLFDMLTTHGPGLRHFLENWTLSDRFDADGNAPATSYLNDMVLDTSNEIESALRHILEDGDNPLVQKDLIAMGALTEIMRMKEGVNDVRPQTLSNILRKAGYVKVQGKRPMIGGVRQYVWTKNMRLNGRNPVDILNERATLGLTETDDWA